MSAEGCYPPTFRDEEDVQLLSIMGGHEKGVGRPCVLQMLATKAVALEEGQSEGGLSNAVVMLNQCKVNCCH